MATLMQTLTTTQDLIPWVCSGLLSQHADAKKCPMSQSASSASDLSMDLCNSVQRFVAQLCHSFSTRGNIFLLKVNSSTPGWLTTSYSGRLNSSAKRNRNQFV